MKRGPPGPSGPGIQGDLFDGLAPARREEAPAKAEVRPPLALVKPLPDAARPPEAQAANAVRAEPVSPARAEVDPVRAQPVSPARAEVDPVRAEPVEAPADPTRGPEGAQGLRGLALRQAQGERGAQREIRPPAERAKPPEIANVAGPAYPWRAPVDAAEAKSRAVLSVAELTRQIKLNLERSFTRVCVKGEISGFRGANPRGHLYFSLKDADACIDVKVWASAAQRLKFKLRDGLEVVIEGSVDVYEPAGRYSLIAQRIDPAGEGALAVAFQQLKEKLAAEGLIGEGRKRAPRPLPRLPRRVGVVTSRSGAALQDFLRVLFQRHPRMSVLVCDARVQGDGAAREVVAAIERLSRTDVDVIVVTRGGGSVEDLWTFNEEIVARAIHACPIPVVSAIGHEVDFTIADFVADHRAPTPTAAAQLVAPVLADLELGIAQARSALRKALERRILEGREVLHRAAARLSDPRRLLGQRRLAVGEQAEKLARAIQKQLRSARELQRAAEERLQRARPQAELARRRQEIGKLLSRLRSAALGCLRGERARLSRLQKAVARLSPTAGLGERRAALEKLRASLEAAGRRSLVERRARADKLAATLDAVSPLGVMARGYAVVLDEQGHVVRGAGDVAPGDALKVKLARERVEKLSDCDELDVEVKQVGRRSP